MKRVVIIVVFVFVALSILINLFEEAEQHESEYNDVCEEYSEEDSINFVVTHHRSWDEYYASTTFCSKYTAGLNDAQASANARNEFAVGSWFDDNDYWRQVYLQLYLNDRDRLQSLQDSLKRVGDLRGLDREEFARMVVSLVQDIPYQYVLPDPCTGNEASPCNGEVAFGLYSPAEFVYSMRGDCDTRTVLLFTLLKNFGYDPLIINSGEYLHSMLALDIPSSGEDFEYKGKKYAYWETTNTGWLPGMLPPDMNNEDYWSVILDYEFQNGASGGH